MPPKFFEHGFLFSRELIAECGVPGTSLRARLYEGNGGATTAFSYLVTLGGTFDEQPVFDSYGYPGGSELRCDSRAIVLHEDGSNIHLTLSKERDRVTNPQAWSNGREVPFDPTEAVTRWEEWRQSAAVALFGILALLWLRALRKAWKLAAPPAN